MSESERDLTRIFSLGHRDLAQKLRSRAGDLWNEIRDEFYKNEDEIITKSEMKKRVVRGRSDEFEMSAKSMQLVVNRFYDALKGYRRKKNSDVEYENLKPPYQDKEYFIVEWTYQEVTMKDGHVILSNGNHEENFCLEWEWASKFEPGRTKLVYNDQKSEFEIHMSFKVKPIDAVQGDGVASIDFGEVHPMTVYDGNDVTIFNGGELRSKFQYFQKEHARLQKELSRKEPGSNRFKDLQREHAELVEKIRKQVQDILHKYSMRLVDMLLREGISTLVLGELTGIRQGLNYGSYVNQKLHSWCFARLKFLVAYKAKLRGMNVQEVPEHDTSKTCPRCRSENSTSDRNYSCSECGFAYHRDGVGALNIWYRYHELNDRKYPGYDQVVGELVPPTGLRYDPEMQCVSSSGRKTHEILAQSASRTTKAA